MKIFNSIQIKKPRSNRFDLTHEKKLSFNMGELIPFYLEEIIPGDNFKVSSEIMIRLAPMLAPIMHRVNVYTHYFFVPHRIVWDEWKDFITGGEDGDKGSPPQLPEFPTTTISDGRADSFYPGTLADYLGVPTTKAGSTVTQDLTVSGLPFRAYGTIYNEYYRDQNLIDKVNVLKTSGNIISAEFTSISVLRKRAWEKDYFTSALPWPQRGQDVNLPVTGTGTPNYRTVSDVLLDDGSPAPAGTLNVDSASDMVVNSTDKVRVENIIDTDVTATSVTINELRNATRLQEWLEKNARAGSRYIEQILSHFGVRSSDARLQRPEYLGGGKNAVVISEVLNTTGEIDATQPVDYAPVGQMYGHGVSVGKSNGFSRSFEEHGYVMGIMSVLPRTAYQQGIERTWTKFDKLDYYWPEFAHLGEQEIANKELYADYQALGGAGSNEQTFGYTPRYAEYRYKQSSVHGDFRDTLQYWHMGRFFDNPPALNEQFVSSDPRQDIFAVEDPSFDKLYCQILNKVSAIRPMPTYATPYL